MKLPTLFAGLDFEGVDHSAGGIVFWCALVVGCLAVLVATYWGIFRRSERRLTWALMLLRGVGLVALLLALAKPSWTEESHLVDAGHVAVVVDNSRSMSLATPAGPSRYDLARAAVDRLRRALNPAGARGRLEIDLYDINGDRFPDGRLPEKPTVDRTDLGRAVSRAVKDLHFKRLNAVVVLSDGTDTTPGQEFKQIAGTVPAPTFAAGFPRTAGSATSFELALEPGRQPPPQRVLLNNEVKIETRVVKTGGPKLEAAVVLQRGLEERLALQKISLPEGNAEQTVTLTLRPAQAGTFQYHVRLETPVKGKATGKDSWSFPLQVDADAIRVLYLEGFLRYEYKFLKARLEDDPDLNVAALVRRINPEQAGPRGGKNLISADQLKNFDVVILGDMEGNYLSAAEYDALVGWLDRRDRDRGEHALLVLGGYRSFGPEGFRKTRLADVLPVVFADGPPYQSEAPFRMRLTEEGRAHPIFSVSNDRVQTEAAWNQAPPLAGCSLVKSAKPAAQVLAVNPDVRVNGKPAVVAAVQRYGAGHTMVLTVDTTWRWSRFPRVLGRSDNLYARFWSQAVRWLAGRTINENRPPLIVSTDRLDYYPGQPVNVTVRRQTRARKDLADARLTVRAAGEGRAPGAEIALRPVADNPDLLTGTFRPATEGKYQVMATLREGTKVLANQGSSFEVYGSDLELGPQADTGTHPENLELLANAGRGGPSRYTDLERVEDLAKRIPRDPRVQARTEETKLWDIGLGPVPGLFLVFIGAVSVEWLLRRRNHLV